MLRLIENTGEFKVVIYFSSNWWDSTIMELLGSIYSSKLNARCGLSDYLLVNCVLELLVKRTFS